MKILKTLIIALLVGSSVCLFVVNNTQNKAIVKLLSEVERQSKSFENEVTNTRVQYGDLISKVDLLSFKDESIVRKYTKLEGDVQFLNNSTDRKLNNLSNINENLSKQYTDLRETSKKLSINQNILESTQIAVVDILKQPNYDYLKSVTVFIKGIGVSFNNMDFGFTGTGTIVDIDEEYTYILSNNHVLDDSNGTCLYVEEEGVNYKIEVISRHPLFDLALGRVKGTITNKTKVRGLSTSKPQDKVFLVGNPIGRKFNYGEGVFAGYDREYAIVQIPVMPGNSGSGVFDQRGNLVGVVFALAGANMGSGIAYDVAHGIIVDGKDVVEFLRKGRTII